MGVFRILQFMIGGCFLAALALFAVIAFGAGPGEQVVAEVAPPTVSVNPLTEDLEQELLAERPAGEGLSFVENLILTVTGRAISEIENAEAAAVLDVTTLNRDHVIEITQDVDLADMIPVGMMGPPDVPKDLFALAQAAAYLRAVECPIILEELATACQVIRIDVDPQGMNVYRIDADIAFVAAAGPGVIPQDTLLRSDSRNFDYHNDTWNKFDAEHHRAFRQATYRRVMAQCAAIVEEIGNCVVEKVRISVLPPRGEPNKTRGRSGFDLKWIDPQQTRG